MKPKFHYARSAAEPKPMREVLIGSLLRRGEIMQVNNAPKSFKTMSVIDLCLSIATGSAWLGQFQAKQGRVLLIDNECHVETVENRLHEVAKHRGINLAKDIEDRFVFDCMRGRLTDIHSMSLEYFEQMKDFWHRKPFDIIVLDALYRFLPSGISENDNAAITAIFNTLDRIAGELNVAIVCVHHTSKGNQSGKAITDVGAGAGAMARANDTYVAIRQHDVEGMHVFEAKTRSFPDPEPLSIKFEWPCWSVKDGIEPALKQQVSQHAQEQQQQRKRDIQTVVDSFQSVERFNWGDVARTIPCGESRARSIIKAGIESKMIKEAGRRKKKRARKASMTYQITATTTGD